jgi:hypothetical protein
MSTDVLIVGTGRARRPVRRLGPGAGDPRRGCLLVRPDAHIAYRSFEVPEDATDVLQQALATLLGR